MCVCGLIHILLCCDEVYICMYLYLVIMHVFVYTFIYLLYISVCMHVYEVYLCVLCGSQNKEQLFPYTALTDWFL
jgi:hypothetical protein